jgi:serine/threonine-protein kinase PknG
MKCNRPPCTGQIVDGYCDLCGMAPARESTAPVRPTSPGEPANELEQSTPTVASSPSTRSSGTTRTRASARNRLGEGWVDVPAIPSQDPTEAVMKDPSVPESRRFCSRCEEPVGRSRAPGEPGRTAGFCSQCRTAFDFEPKLKPGGVVEGHYDVVGCLAHGGMGWVYLAKDRRLSNRPVALKGLLNSSDADANEAAAAEREFLTEVNHPNIVKIYDLPEYEGAAYIAMEYVGGQSLKQILAERRLANGKRPDPLPVTHAIAYMLEILPALGYLHDRGLIYCDFKPDNVMHTGDEVKLIDLGGVYRIGDAKALLFGTTGFQAPEISTAGPSIASDLFTVARTLAVLCIDFTGFRDRYRFTLPSQESVPVFARYDSLYRFLCKATAPEPANRFQSAAEMEDQLRGVLREIVSEEENRPVPAPSTEFTAALRASIEQPDWQILPRPQVSSDDPSAGYLAAVTAADPEQMIGQLEELRTEIVTLAGDDPNVTTTEVDLRLAAVMIEAGDFDGAQARLDGLVTPGGGDWRVDWYRGVADLARGNPSHALANFKSVYYAVPGELAPKLALAMACEMVGDFPEAAHWYEIVSRTDPSTTSASFGLARCRFACRDRGGAIAAYRQVPDSSSGYVDAQVAQIRCLNSFNGVVQPSLDDICAAGSILEQLPLGNEQRERLSADLLESALMRLAANGKPPGDSDARLLGHQLIERDLRLRLERSYRVLARGAGSRSERIRLVDAANRTRPRTWT